MSYKYYTEAGYGKRFGAYCIDNFIVAITTVIFLFLFSRNQKLFLTAFVFLQILVWLYFILMNKFCRGTVGKIIFKLIIINHDEKKADDNLSWETVFLRQLLTIVPEIPNIIIPVICTILVDDWQGLETFDLVVKGYQATALGGFFLGVNLIISIVEIIVTLVNEENRSLHDLIADTIVIEE